MHSFGNDDPDHESIATKKALLCFGCLDMLGYLPGFYAEKLGAVGPAFRKAWKAQIQQTIDEHDQRMLQIQRFLTVRWQVWVVG